jgi:hypothetical protein
MIAATIAPGRSQTRRRRKGRANIGAIFVGNRECDVNRGRGMRQRNLHHAVNWLTVKGGVYHDDEMRTALGVEMGRQRSRLHALGFV